MREIKYRAWDKEKKQMVPVSDISFGDDGSALTVVFQPAPKGEYYRGLVNGENGILMQYTGLKDKNGQEIYEGDIILTGDAKWRVAWHRHENGMDGWMVQDNKIHHWYEIDKSILAGEVIGNTYERGGKR